MKERHETIEEVSNDLNKHSGLLGICGKNDYRDVRELSEMEISIEAEGVSFPDFISKWEIATNEKTTDRAKVITIKESHGFFFSICHSSFFA